MKNILLFLIYLVLNVANAQSPEFFLDARNQRRIAENLKNSYDGPSLKLLKEKVAALPNTKEGLTESRKLVNVYIQDQYAAVAKRDATQTFFKSGIKAISASAMAIGAVPTIASSATTLGLGSLAVPGWIATAAPKIQALYAGMGEFGKLIENVAPDSYKKVVDYLDPDKARDLLYDETDKNILLALDIIDEKASSTFKNRVKSNVTDPYIKVKSEQIFSDGKIKKTNSTLTIEQAEELLKKSESQLQLTNEVLGNRIAEAAGLAQRNYLITLETKKDINRIKNDIKNVNQELRKTNLKVEDIIKKQTELKALTESLAVKVDLGFKATNARLGKIEENLAVLNDAALQKIFQDQVGIPTILRKLNDMKTGKIPNYLGSELDETIKSYETQLERVKFEQFAKTVDTAVAYGQLGLKIMQKYNIGSEKDQKFVSDVILVVQGAIAIGKAWNGDPTALINFGMTLMGGEPSPSPEMQMLKIIDQKLDQIQKSIDGLNENLINVHKDLVERFNFVNEQLAGIREEMYKNQLELKIILNDVNNTLSVIQIQNQNIDTKLIKSNLKYIYACENPYGLFTGKIQPTLPIKTKSNLNYLNQEPEVLNAIIKGAACEKCLEELLYYSTTNFPKEKRTDFNYQFVDKKTDDFNTIKDLTYPDLYKELLSIWRSNFKNEEELNYGLIAMLDPSLNASNSMDIYKALLAEKPSINPDLNFNDTFATQGYIHSPAIIDMVNYFYEFYPILELYDQKSGKVMANIHEVRANKDFITSRLNILDLGLKNTLIMVNRALAHEALMSGYMVFDKFKEILNTNNSPLSKNVFKILRSNPIIAQNFASYLFSTTIQTEARYNDAYKKYDNKEGKFVTFVGDADENLSSYFFLTTTEKGQSLGIQKQYYDPNDVTNGPLITEYLELPLAQESEFDPGNTVPFTERNVIDRFIPTKEFIDLLVAKEKITSLIAQKQMLYKAASKADSKTELSQSSVNFMLYYDSSIPNFKADIASNGVTQTCEGEKITLFTNESKSNYQWYKNGEKISNSNSSKFDVRESGVYQVLFSDPLDPTILYEISDTLNVKFGQKPVLSQSQGYTVTGIEKVQMNQQLVQSNTIGLSFSWSSTPKIPIEGNVSSTPVLGPFKENTTISYTVSDKSGCQSVGTFQVLYKPCELSLKITGADAFCTGSSVSFQAAESNGNGDYKYRWVQDNSEIGNAKSININKPGSIYAEVTDLKGCTARSNVVNLKQVESLNVSISGSNAFCLGNSITLKANVSSIDVPMFSWSVDGKTVFGNGSELKITQGGQYIVNVEDSKGCKGISQKFLVEEKGVKAELGYDGPLSVFEPNTVTLRATKSANAAYQWSQDGIVITGASGDFLVVKKTGLYGVSISKDGCVSNSEALKVTVSQVLGVINDMDESISIAPNPAYDKLTVSGLPKVNSINIQIIDVSGKSVFRQAFNSKQGKVEVETSKLTPGLYYLIVESKNGLKFIKW